MVKHRCRDRPAEVESLQLRTAQLPHHVGLHLRFHAFRGCFHVKPAGQGEDGMDDRDTVAGAFRSASDEALIDLDLGEMSAAQITE